MLQITIPSLNSASIQEFFKPLSPDNSVLCEQLEVEKLVSCCQLACIFRDMTVTAVLAPPKQKIIKQIDAKEPQNWPQNQQQYCPWPAHASGMAHNA
jgi:predicted transcriptional regulator